MPGAIYETLQKHYNTINTQYEDHLDTVRELQKTLVLEILPGLVDELGLDDCDKANALQWLQDAREYC